LGQRTTATQASKLANDLVGNFANLKPGNPDRFLDAVEQVLGQYPPAIGQECVDPVHGIVAKVEFLSIKSLVDWCEARLSFYRTIAAYVPRATPPPGRQIEAGPITKEQCDNLMAKVAEVLRANTTLSPLEKLLNEVTDARRLRIEEVYRAAYGDDKGNVP